jgi:hypothetical protein
MHCIEPSRLNVVGLKVFGVLRVLSLEDRIRELCTQIAVASDDAALGELFAELRAALHEHAQQTRFKVAQAQDVARVFHLKWTKDVTTKG